MKNENENIETENNQETINTKDAKEKETLLKVSFVEEEQDLTEADSGINQSMKKIKNESPLKKNKGFCSVFNKPIQKNFFFGGDYSDLFNNKDEEAETKRFKTVKINKKNNINKINDYSWLNEQYNKS